MSTLKETLAECRNGELAVGGGNHLPKGPTTAVQIHQTNGESWVLPWSHFISARHERNGNAEKLVLSFTEHEVMLEGFRLMLLLPEIASFRLESLRELPKRYEVQVAETEPFVQRISVRVLAADPNVSTGS